MPFSPQQPLAAYGSASPKSAPSSSVHSSRSKKPHPRDRVLRRDGALPFAKILGKSSIKSNHLSQCFQGRIELSPLGIIRLVSRYFRRVRFNSLRHGNRLGTRFIQILPMRSEERRVGKECVSG